MKKQIFYTYKFKSSRLAEFNYDIGLKFDDAKKNKEVISMFDCQLLRSVRHVTGKEIDFNRLNKLKFELEKIKKEEHSDENVKKINELQGQVNEILFVPEIISIVMENKQHYRYLFRNKLKLNGREFRRFSCSAGQARVSTVLFCDTEIADKLDEIFDNGRNKDMELVPSKFNAYKGLITSSTSVVSTPRFCLVPDYFSETDVKVNWVTETDITKDDIIEEREIIENFNRFDGQGLISYRKSKQWAEELGLDYVPAQWCVRHNYIKGMLSTFDIHKFCEKKNKGKTVIKTSYKDENGNPKLVDLKDIDVIISESQFKLWDSFSSIEEYNENCKKNNLQWGVSLFSPKKDKDILKMNYQFLQTLNLNQQDVEKVCNKFVNWITKATSEDINYTILFLLGVNNDEDRIIDYLKNSENHWIKSLMIDHELIHDKWIKKKIYDMIKKKIKNGCLGQILVDGNFQVIVSDPYAQMQHVCGLDVTGLLDRKEYYSNYWNEKGINLVDSMRAPLTYRSEHVLLNLKQNEEMDYWYKYNTSGIIVNVHGHETMNWAGSDFDFDILATTSDETIIKGVYQNELPVAYEAPKSNKYKLEDKLLYNADLHSFGSEIGQITNKSTSAYALLPLLEEDSEEYSTTMNRIRMCTKLQSAQIDKAKIGRRVKSIPKIWLNYNKITDNDSEDVIKEKEFLNNTLLNKHPYFFTYLYTNTRRKYKNYYNNQDATCRQKFGVGLDELKKLKRKTVEQLEFLNIFNKYSPVIDSDCVMNRICRYIESIDFGIRNIVNKDDELDFHNNLMFNEHIEIDNKIYSKIKKAFKEFKEQSQNLAATSEPVHKENDNESIQENVKVVYDELQQSLTNICSNDKELVDYLIHMFYVDKMETNKEVLWGMYGQIIFDNIKSKFDKAYIPIPDKNGEIEYLNKKFTLKEVDLINE